MAAVATAVLFVASFVVDDPHRYVWACEAGARRSVDGGSSYPNALVHFVPSLVWLLYVGERFRRNARRR